MSGRTPQDFARDTDPMAIRLAGMVRRFVVASTAKIVWRLTGVQLLDGDTEQRDVEVFSGIGFYARPLASKDATPEAIVVNVGGATVPVIVATRDAKGLSKLLSQVRVTAGDTVVYSGAAAALVIVKANGTVEVRAPSGTALSLPTMADFEGLREYVYNQFRGTGGHTHVTPMGPTTTTAASNGTNPAQTPPVHAPPTPAGTTVLKAQ